MKLLSLTQLIMINSGNRLRAVSWFYLLPQSICPIFFTYMLQDDNQTNMNATNHNQTTNLM